MGPIIYILYTVLPAVVFSGYTFAWSKHEHGRVTTALFSIWWALLFVSLVYSGSTAIYEQYGTERTIGNLLLYGSGFIVSSLLLGVPTSIILLIRSRHTNLTPTSPSVATQGRRLKILLLLFLVSLFVYYIGIFASRPPDLINVTSEPG